jgi:hypothetical protein
MKGGMSLPFLDLIWMSMAIGSLGQTGRCGLSGTSA